MAGLYQLLEPLLPLAHLIPESRQAALRVAFGKAELAEMLATIGKGMPNGIRLTIAGVTAQGDRVAVEMDADGVSATGREYHNHYHDLLEVRDGKIHAGREYLDTAHAQEIIVGSIPA
jgi:predicted SnoaL-like aldol condensation-catalyzing enzyme